jgi:hypothetical protein
MKLEQFFVTATLVFVIATLALGVSTVAQALPYSEAVVSEAMLQGGSESTTEWAAPVAGKSRVFVFVPKGSTAVTATYRIYPKGNQTDNTACSSTDTVSPCFEAIINQVAHQGKLVQLVADKEEVFDFSERGVVSVVASASADTEMVGTAGARFEQEPRRQEYSKVSNSGEALNDTATLGTGPSDWGCTRDDNTRLMWEIKTSDGGLRDKDNQYSWYNPDPATNGGDAGLQNGGAGLCAGDISCDTHAYIQAVNAQGLCGFSDWRLPTYRELVGLLEPSLFPAINPDFFPNTSNDAGPFRHWTSTVDLAYNTHAWFVFFGNGSASTPKSSAPTFRIRLVRSEEQGFNQLVISPGVCLTCPVQSR